MCQKNNFFPALIVCCHMSRCGFTKFIALVMILMSGTRALMPPSTEQTNTLNAEFIMQPF